MANVVAQNLSRLKIPQHIKGLLALRNPDPLPLLHGDSHGIGSARDLEVVLEARREEIRRRVYGDQRPEYANTSEEHTSARKTMDGAEKGWLVVATATLLTANSPASLAHLYHVSSSAQAPGSTARTEYSGRKALPLPERAERAALMREAGLKCAVVVGAPRTINCLGGLKTAFEDDVKETLDSISYRAQSSQAEIRDRGVSLFDSIYHPHTEKLLNKLGDSHPDFSDFVIQHAYGGLLSNPYVGDVSSGRSVVSRTLTSAMLIACLRTEGGVGPQLLSHVYGILKAPSFELERQNEAEQWLSTFDGVEWILNMVDDICKSVGK